MTVQNQNVKNVYRGNGSTTEFPFTFAVNENHPEILHVYITNDGGIAEETMDFLCDMNTRKIIYPKPTSNAEPLSAAQRLTIYRLVPYTQNLNLVNQGPFFAEDVEQTFDDEEMQIQQLHEVQDRTLKVGVEATGFDSTVPIEPGKAIQINEHGTGFVLTDGPETVLMECRNVLADTRVLAGQAAGSAADAAEEARNAKEEAENAAGMAQNAANNASAASITNAQVQSALTDADALLHQVQACISAATVDAFWNSAQTYEPGEVIMTSDGSAYRCIQENTNRHPATSPAYWVQMTSTELMTFEIDGNGDLMPMINPSVSQNWELDENTDIMPSSMTTLTVVDNQEF